MCERQQVAPQSQEDAFAAFAKKLVPGSSLLTGACSSHRILFLDVDGVLNTIASLTSPKSIVMAGWPGPLSRPLLVRLGKILQATRARVVLSSTWRLTDAGVVALMRGMEQVGMDPQSVIVGSTPSFSGPGRRRAHEIADWLESHGPCIAWAAVDDLDLWSEDPKRMGRNTVKTLISSGLQQEQAAALVSILRDHGAAAACDARRTEGGAWLDPYPYVVKAVVT